MLERLDVKVQLTRIRTYNKLQKIGPNIKQHYFILENVEKQKGGEAISALENHIISRFND